MLAALTLGAGLATAEGRDVDSAVAATKALAAARPGDEIRLADGLYKDFRLTIEANGTPEKPVTFRAAHPGKAILTGGSTVLIRGRDVVVADLVFDQAWGREPVIALRGAERCRLTGCAFIECGNPHSTFGRIVELSGGARSNRVDHCYMQGNLSVGMGVKVGAPGNLGNTDNVFDHDYFRDMVHRSNNGQENVQLGQGPAGETAVRALVECCLFERANGDPEAISNKTSFNRIRYNTFRDCDYAELTLRGGTHTRAEGNFFFRCKGGVRVYGQEHQVVNNYIEGCQRGICLPHGDSIHEAATHCLVAFNTIVDCKKVGLSLEAAGGAEPADATLLPRENRCANNLVVGHSGTLAESAHASNAWEQNIVWPREKAVAGLKHAGIVEKDPGLVQGGGTWRLPVSGSAASGAAKPLAAMPLADDIDGQPRSGTPDIGCDQASAAPVLRRPLEPRDVGPMWLGGDPSSLRRIANPQPIPMPENPANKKH